MTETANIQGTCGDDLTIVLPRKTNCRPTEAELQEWACASSHVYFIYSAGLIKIGYSANWLRRLEAVSQGCAHPSELILVMPGDRALESGYHDLFAEYRVNREWFRCEGKVREFLMHFASAEGQEALELAEQSYAENSQ